MIRKWGQVIKAKRAQKPECLPYTEKEKKNSAILNPSPIVLTILKSRSFAILQYKWEKKKESLETQIHMQQLNLHHFLFTVSSKGRNGLFLCYAQDCFEYEAITSIPSFLKVCLVPLGFYKDLY